MKNGILTVSLKDWAKGAVTAIVGAFAVTVYGIMKSGFDVTTADWKAIGIMCVNAAVISLVSYIGTTFLSDNQGKVLGKIG